MISQASKRYYRKTFRIRAEDSPNVRLGLEQFARGEEPTGEFVVPGVKGYEEYVKQRRLLDEALQSVVLDAEWYKGTGNLLYPPEWLDRAAEKALTAVRRGKRFMGVDSAEGGDSTVWVIVDASGVVYLESKKTKDTAEIPAHTMYLMNKQGVRANDVLFDNGGGGKQHTDHLRDLGYGVRSVAFGEKPSPVDRFKRYTRSTTTRIDDAETQYVYKNRRAEMYGILRQLLDPSNATGFAIPMEYAELRRQLSPIPLWYDEGRLYLPPKQRKPDAGIQGTNKVTMHDLIGCSPDEADALVLATFALVEPATQMRAGVF
jgi:hypothetical protein